MKKILLEYIAIPAAIKVYILLGITIFKVKQLKAYMLEHKIPTPKPALKHVAH